MDSEFWKDRKVLVTGGSGFLGRWLLKALAAAGAEISVVDIAPVPEDLGVDCSFYNVNLQDCEACKELLATAGPEVIIHLAGQAGVSASHNNPTEAYERNVLCTFSLLEACRDYNGLQAIVAASSNHVYGEQEETPTAESASLNGLGMYAISKLCSDVIAQSYGKTYGLPIGVARITNSFGGDDPHAGHIITGTILSVLKGEQPVIKQSGRDTKAFLYVEDTVAGFVALAEAIAQKPELHGEAFNFVPDEPVSVQELVEEIISVVGADLSPIIERPDAEFESEHLDNSKARENLAWSPQYSFREALEKTLAWYKEQS